MDYTRAWLYIHALTLRKAKTQKFEWNAWHIQAKVDWNIQAKIQWIACWKVAVMHKWNKYGLQTYIDL